MTIEQKRAEVMAYCDRHFNCDGCVLSNNDHGACTLKSEEYGFCLDIAETTEEDLDTALALINGTYVKSDAVNHPSYYADGKIEPIEFIEDKKLGFCLGNAVKYISRAGKKDPSKEIEDLKKAIFYIEYRIKQLESEG